MRPLHPERPLRFAGQADHLNGPAGPGATKPAPGPADTARDLARLADLTIREHPQLYKQFYSRREFTWGKTLGSGQAIKQPNRDPLLGRVESEMKNIATLVIKTGYAVNPQTLVYGTLGVARGDFDYTLSTGDFSQTRGFTATGAAGGLGVERMINPRTSIFAEYQYRDFGNERVEFSDGIDTLSTRASMTMSSVKIGANFRF